MSEAQMAPPGVEPVGAREQPQIQRPPPKASRRGDAKKLVVLAVLLVIGLAVVAYQFLRGRSPKKASASPTAPSAVAPPAGSNLDVERVLKRIERGRPGTLEEGPDLSVARVEQLVSEFDAYVRSRQIPLAHLSGNPFVVRLSESVLPPPPPVEEEAEPEPVEPVVDPAVVRRERLTAAADRIAVGSILVGASDRMAVLDGRVCREGDTVGELTVREISPNAVTLGADDFLVTLELFGEAPGL